MIQNLKFTLGNILAILAALVYAWYCFLSHFFLSIGKIWESLGWALGISIALLGLAFFLKWLKRTQNHFKVYFVTEMICLIVFGIGSFMAMPFFTHYFVVSARSENIQRVMLDNIRQIQPLFEKYDNYADTRISTYRGTLQRMEVNNKAGIRNRINTLKEKLRPNTEYPKMKEQDSIWLASAVTGFQRWQPKVVVEVVRDLDTQSSMSISRLVQYSQYRDHQGQLDRGPDFSFTKTLTDVTPQFVERGNPDLLYIFTGYGLCLIMLLPYFAEDRSTKFQWSALLFKGRREGNSL